VNRYVVDASVAVKWFVPEIRSESAVKLLRPENVLAAPDLLITEFCNTLWKKTVRRELEADQALRCLKDLNRMPLQLYPSTKLAHDAFQISIRERLSVYASLYLALASLLDCHIVTADERLRKSIRDGELKQRVLLLAASGFPG
jgi:predicted nucleic acid-binding protein